ncbi:MAG: cupin domain-containing protein [Sphingomonadaceae bacterium]|nr:cupin domain-containing protein [Sphingomonadaceae bacterium]
MSSPPITAAEAPIQRSPVAFPPDFAARLAGLERRALTAPFGLRSFGVGFTRIRPGHGSGLHHSHRTREEFVFVLEGEAVLVGDGGAESVISAGMCAGFAAGRAHHLENRGAVDLVYLDVTAPTPGDTVTFPDDDLVVTVDGFARRDGTPYRG